MAIQLSRRARRSERQQRAGRLPQINLVSLMDIFTILVFFLLVNTGEMEVLPFPRDVTLPESTADARTRTSPVISITPEEIRFEGKPVIAIAEVERSADSTIPALSAVLARPEREEEPSLITIMGDREAPYRLLKKIMLTCSQSGYSNIALAVQKAAE